MIINSQFYICQYNGKQPLPLMGIPESLNNDPVKRAEYNRFIQSIDTIYSTQDIDGDIPKFWTTRTQQTDALGNISYKYVPHPESTLESLSSATSYYFILRDSTLLPVKIPVIGGEIIGFSDISSLPIVDGVSSCKGSVIECEQPTTADDNTNNETNQQTVSNTCCRSISVSGNNVVDIIFNLKNLRPLESYLYSIESVGANWPVNISPLSGVFKPAKTEGQIKVDALFCPGTGYCGNNILAHSIDNDCLLTDNSIKYANIQLSITPNGYTDDNFIINSDHYSIVCEDCLPKLGAVFLIKKEGYGEDETEKTINSSNFENLPFDEFIIQANRPLDNNSGYPNNINYIYSVEVLKAEYPIIFVSPMTGVISIRSSEFSGTQRIKYFFCPTTGLCPPNGNNIPDYTIPSYPKFLFAEDSVIDSKLIKMRISIEHYDCPGQKVYSNTRTITFIQ